MTSKETKKMTARMLTAVLAAGACLAIAAPTALADAPALKLTATSQPTNFAPGVEATGQGDFATFVPQYNVLATNVGTAPTSGPITFTDTLPEGLTVDGAVFKGPGLPGGFDSPCAVSGQEVTCEYPFSLQPNKAAQFVIAVDVAADAPASVVNPVSVTGGGAAEARTTTTTTISSAAAPFEYLSGPTGLSIAATGLDGAAATQAGSHPGQVTIDIGLPSRLKQNADGASTNALFSSSYLRQVETNLPRGMVANPSTAPVRCTEAQLETERCPDASAVGVVTVTTNLGFVVPAEAALYNMVPPPGEAAELAFDATGKNIWVHLMGGVNAAGEFELGTRVSEILARELNPIFGAKAQLWGNPSDESHDTMRGLCAKNVGVCPLDERNDAPFVTMPSSCSDAPEVNAIASSWEEPSKLHTRSAQTEDSLGNPTSTEGCNALEFEPTIEAKPTTNLAESPSGLDFNLHQRQNPELEDLATAPVKDLTIALPQGMTLNPSAAAGLEGCSSAQIGLSTAIGQSPIHFNEAPVDCPEASKLGTVEVTTPVLAKYDANNEIELDPETGQPIPDPLVGAAYLAKPFDNPFDSLLAIYLTVEDPDTGIIAKVPGKITADPQSGQLVTRILNGPELPLEDVNVHLFGGARGPLITPPLCGDHTTTSTFTPWSTPEGQDAHPSSSFATTTFPGGGNCPTSAGQAPNSPSFDAGTIAPVAGAYSPFTIKLNREDGSQRLTGVSATLPPGLIGKLAGIAQCSEAQIAAAKAREVPKQGAVELASSSCPASSEVGVLDVSGGAGPTPFHVGGHAYLSGPYKGAPLSLTIITPAIAGPFDLGAVVLRVALNVDAEKAQIHAVSDPFPTVLEGIPLDIRGATMKLGRPDFTLNPTSCDPMAIEALTSTIPGQLASLRSPFQVGGCSGLGFKPKLALQLKGGTKRGGHPGLIATYRPRPGDANLKGLVVRLPRSAFLDQAHIRTICTRVQFAAASCPKGAQYGYIKAWTPLLDTPLEGPVWLRSSDHKLPDLVFDLHGTVDIEVATRIDSSHGGIRARIESSPDAPLSKVVLRMQGAKKGLIVNSRNLCGTTSKANVELTGQNGKESSSNPVMQADCGGKGKRKR
jgi:hypothetical protein